MNKPGGILSDGIYGCAELFFTFIKCSAARVRAICHNDGVFSIFGAAVGSIKRQAVSRPLRTLGGHLRTGRIVICE